MKKYFRIVYMGTPDFAVPSLERLVSEGHDVICSVTQPDRKRGRGGKVTFCPVKKKALELEIPVFQPERVRKKEAVEYIRSLEPDLLITCAYGQILPESLLETPVYGCINVHASLLPKYRGAAPIQRAILNGDSKTGITTMMTDIGMDTGDILIKEEIELSEDTTAGELHDELMYLGAQVLSKTLRELSNGTLERVKQVDSEATYAPMLKKEESIVDWSEDSFSIHNKVRAFDPWPGCFTEYNGKRMRITKSSYNHDYSGEKPGILMDASAEGLMVGCGTGTILIKGLQFENSRRMDVRDCWHNFEKGNLFGKGD